MAIIGRSAVTALIFAGSVATAAYAVHDRDFYHGVNGAVASLTDHLMQAGSMVAGDRHLADPSAPDGIKSMDRIASSSVVTHVEVIGGGTKQRIVLLNPDGEEVYSHDPITNTTIVAKDVIVPSITVREGPDSVAELRVVTAAPAMEAPEELRQALVTGEVSPNLFYREDL